MKVLVVNGSPKGPKSNTMQMTNAVLKGLKETNPEAEIELLTVKDMYKQCGNTVAVPVVKQIINNIKIR